MAYNEALADRIRIYLGAHPRISEKKMFGGLSFLLDGKMTIGIIKEDLMVRVLSSKEKDLLAKPGIEEMKFTGKAMKEFLAVKSAAYKEDKDLHKFIELGIEHAEHKLANSK